MVKYVYLGITAQYRITWLGLGRKKKMICYTCISIYIFSISIVNWIVNCVYLSAICIDT